MAIRGRLYYNHLRNTSISILDVSDTNPLFPDNDQPQDHGYLLPRQDKHIDPAPATEGANEAIELIRKKLERIYAEEPDPLAEERKAVAAPAPRSKHQQFMYELSVSGKSLAEIQTAWHNYYTALPDAEKHQVWQEFYAANGMGTAAQPRQPLVRQPKVERVLPAALSSAYTQPRPLSPITPSQPTPLAQKLPFTQPPRPQHDSRTPAQLSSAIRRKVSAGGRLKARHHLQSLGFGLAIGLVTIVITLFSFFNEVIIAPFIQPGRASATPIIIDPNAASPTSTPELIIPKINLEIPVDFSQTSDDENAIQNALENGIVHYPSTVKPGQTGNAAFFGHSSNNIFNPGKYKFAFVLLHEIQPGDTFYIAYDGKVYVYKVFDRKVVDPTNVGVLDNVPGHTATATLITCDPPGTTLHRLVVIGDQVSPDPLNNAAGSNTISTAPSAPTELPDNGPTLWDRIWQSIF